MCKTQKQITLVCYGQLVVNQFFSFTQVKGELGNQLLYSELKQYMLKKGKFNHAIHGWSIKKDNNHLSLYFLVVTSRNHPLKKKQMFWEKDQKYDFFVFNFFLMITLFRTGCKELQNSYPRTQTGCHRRLIPVPPRPFIVPPCPVPVLRRWLFCVWGKLFLSTVQPVLIKGTI